MRNLISDSPMLPTELADDTLDHKSIIIDATPAITLTLGGGPQQDNPDEPRSDYLVVD